MTNHQSPPSLVFYPDLCSRLIIKQRSKRPLKFFCYCYCGDYKVELWSNLSTHKQWQAFPFTQVEDSNEHQLAISTDHLNTGDYEFTFRFSRTGNERWQWYGSPGQNGSFRVLPRFPGGSTAAPSFATTVPQLCFVTAKKGQEKVDLEHFRTQRNAAKSFSLGQMNHPIHSFVSLIRKGSCWLTPVAGQSTFDQRNPEEKWQLLLYQDAEHGNIHLWMAVGQKADCWLSPGPNNTINFHHNYANDEDTHLLICSSSNKHNYNKLIQTALDYYNKTILKKQVKKEEGELLQNDSVMLDKLGYCTWNAFGKSVNTEKLTEALDSLQKNDIPIAYAILDDGWQSSICEQLISLEADKEKFPGGLQNTISKLKARYPFVQYVGVWHALWGYWNGIDQQFAQERRYDSYQTVKDNRKEDIGVMKDPQKFYYDFYNFLKGAGVDFVKVDNQGGFQNLEYDMMGLWDTYRRVMVDSADAFLNGRIVHSMAFTPHILFDPILSQKNKSVFRNSDDFFPDEEKSHSWHNYANAINSLWTTTQPAIVGDWDMFQSDHPFAEYHAASRAISGGPIYITDTPNKHNTALIYKLIAQTRHNEYTVLRSAKPPQPAFETVFGNPMENGSLVCLYNLHSEKQQHDVERRKPEEEYGVCGFWNTGSQDKLGVVTSDLFCSRKLPMSPTVAYVVSGPDQGKVAFMGAPSRGYNDEDDNNDIILSRSSRSNSSRDSLSSTSSQKSHSNGGAICVRVQGLGCSLVSISHVRSVGAVSIACLGLIDKYNGTRAISHTSLIKHQPGHIKYEAHLTHRSSFCGFWVKSQVALKKIALDTQVLRPDVDWTYDSMTGLLKVDMMAVALDITSENTFCIQIYL